MLDQLINEPQLDFTMLVTCFNESDFIVKTLETVTGAMEESGLSYEVIVIDDVSTDNSVELIRHFMAEHPELPVRIHVNANNQGVGNNFIDGAFLGRGKYYRVTDGDCPESKETLLYLCNQIGKADMIIPVMKNNDMASGRSLLRVAISKTYTGLVNLLSGYKIIYYNQSPIIPRYYVMRYPSFTTGLAYQADIVTRILDQGISFIQVPVLAFDLKGPSSTALSLANFLSAAHTLLEITLRRLKRIVGRMAYGPNSVPQMGKELPFAEDDGDKP